MTDIIAGIPIPDSALANAATNLVRDTAPDLIFHHSRRVFLFGSIRAKALRISPDPEILYVSALFHDLGLVPEYQNPAQRFELDGADYARDFLTSHGITEPEGLTAWTAIALHTTPEMPYRLAPEIAATTAGVETDVLGLHLDRVTASEIHEVTAAHPRPDFKAQILRGFNDGFKDRPDTTFGTVNADVLEHFDSHFHHINFVDVIQKSDWAD